jgi:trigger factor
VKTSLETLDEVKVRLAVEVEPQRVKQAFDRAARELSRQVSLPGFRPGKAPRRLLEQRLGTGAIAQAAMEDAIGDYYLEALQAEDVNPVGQPDLDVERFDETEGCAFTATVEIRPTFEPPDHTGISVTHPDWEVGDDEVAEQLEQMRERFAEVDVVERPAASGDLVTLDLRVEVDGEELESARVSDALYEVGSGGVTPILDQEIVGKQAGDEFSYADSLPDDYPDHGGAQATFHVSVTDVREKSLPALDDDFATTASAFDTLDELRADVRASLLRMRIQQARHELRGRVLEAYLARVDVPLPPAMVDGEVAERLHRLEHQAEQYGMDIGQLLELQGTTRDDFEARAREEASDSVKARLVLDELAQQLDVPIAAADIEAEIARHARASGMPPDEVARVIQEQGTLPVLAGDVLRRKAIDVVVEAAEVTGGPDDALLADLGLVEQDDADADQDADDDGPGLIVPGAESGEPESELIVPSRD